MRRAYYTLSIVEWTFRAVPKASGPEALEIVERIRKRVASLTPLLLDGEAAPILTPRDHKRHQRWIRDLERITRRMIAEVPDDFVPYSLVALELVDNLLGRDTDTNAERQKHWRWMLQNLTSFNLFLEARILGISYTTYRRQGAELMPYDPDTEDGEHGTEEKVLWVAMHNDVLTPKYAIAARYAERLRRAIDK